MRVIFNQRAFEELSEWVKENPRTVKKIFELIDDIKRTPYSGLGKPEPLKYELAGFWSRRITEEPRLVYAIAGTDIAVISCRTHYK